MEYCPCEISIEHLFVEEEDDDIISIDFIMNEEILSGFLNFEEIVGWKKARLFCTSIKFNNNSLKFPLTLI